MHQKARTLQYGADVQRTAVPDHLVDWKVEHPTYAPVNHTDETVRKRPVWADPDIGECGHADIRFNELEAGVDRRSHEGVYQVIDGVPRNPVGRTGMSGRGLCGKWGPNHAADPIITRWLRTSNGESIQKEGRPVLEVVVIQRRDTLAWALPGGMCDPGENVSLTCEREFSEEALNSLELGEEMRADIKQRVDELFRHGTQIYKGYVDDPRNTDNAWMETVAVNFHDESGVGVGKIPLNAGDDAQSVRWLPINTALKLYASHADFIRDTCRLHGAYFQD